MTGRQRLSDGTFAPGNKAGSGTKRRVPKTILRQAITDTDLSSLLRDGLAKAKAGDASWAQFIIGRMVPPVKAVSPTIVIDLDTDTALGALRGILQATADGQVSTDQARDLITAVQALSSMEKTEDLERRLAALEEKRVRSQGV